MADRQAGKSWGPWGSVPFTAVVLAYLLIAPVGAHAATPVPSTGVQLPAVVPAGAQAAVGAVVAQASAAPVPAAAAAAVPAPVRAAAADVTARVRAAAAAVSAPSPQAAPSVPHVSVPSVPAPSVAPTAPPVNVPRVTVPRVPLPSPQRAPSQTPALASSAVAGAAQQTGSVGAQLAGAHTRSGGRPESVKPSGRPPARPPTGAVAHQASRRVATPLAWQPIAAGASAASVERAGPSQPVRAARIPERRPPLVVHHAPVRDIGITEASATAWPTVPTTASLPPGGAGGPSAGGSGGAAGGIAAAVLALAALVLLRGFLPGLLALDVVPWRSALLAFRLERPG